MATYGAISVCVVLYYMVSGDGGTREPIQPSESGMAWRSGKLVSLKGNMVEAETVEESSGWDMKNYQADEYSDDSPGLYDVDDPVSETGSIFGKNLRSKLTSVRTSREYEDVEEGMVSNGDDEDWGDWEDDNAKEPIDGDAMPSEREEEEYSYEDGDEKDLEDENLEDASSKSTETPNGEDTALTPPALGAEDEAPAKEAQSEMTVVESSIVEDEGDPSSYIATKTTSIAPPPEKDESKIKEEIKGVNPEDLTPPVTTTHTAKPSAVETSPSNDNPEVVVAEEVEGVKSKDLTLSTVPAETGSPTPASSTPPSIKASSIKQETIMVEEVEVVKAEDLNPPMMTTETTAPQQRLQLLLQSTRPWKMIKVSLRKKS